MLPTGVDIEQAGPVCTCTFDRREVTHLEMAELVNQCIEKMRYDNARHFVFNMESVEFLASSCIGAMVEMLQELEHMHGKIALAGCQDNVLFLLKVTKLDAVFGIYDDVADATASF